MGQLQSSCLRSKTDNSEPTRSTAFCQTAHIVHQAISQAAHLIDHVVAYILKMIPIQALLSNLLLITLISHTRTPLLTTPVAPSLTRPGMLPLSTGIPWNIPVYEIAAEVVRSRFPPDTVPICPFHYRLSPCSPLKVWKRRLRASQRGLCGLKMPSRNARQRPLLWSPR